MCFNEQLEKKEQEITRLQSMLDEVLEDYAQLNNQQGNSREKGKMRSLCYSASAILGKETKKLMTSYLIAAEFESLRILRCLIKLVSCVRPSCLSSS